jgi:hypothetical protein
LALKPVKPRPVRILAPFKVIEERINKCYILLRRKKSMYTSVSVQRA